VTYAKIQNVSATDKVLGRVTAGAGVVEEIATTGSGNVVRATSPTLVTPTLGAATATTINKVTITQPTTSATLTIADGKTLTANNSIVVAGTDATTMTFPTTDATIARTDAAQTFTGVQTFSSDMVVNSVNIGRGGGAIVSNTAVGSGTLLSNSTGTSNTGLGYQSLLLNTTGIDNTAFGANAGDKISSGSKNIFVGTFAGSKIASALANSAGSNSVLIGYDVRPAADSQTNQIVISGYNGTSGTVGLGSNTTLIGSTKTQKSQLYGALTVVPNAATTSTDGNSSTIAAQDAGTGATNAGGSVNITAGNGNSTGLGGNIVLTPGTSSTAANNGIVQVNGQIKITGGSPAAGEVLVSDANGLATWSNALGSAVITTTASYAITLAESIVFYTGTSAGTFSIPAATAYAGKEITIKNKTAFGISITPASGTIYIDNANASAASVSIGIEASNNWIKLVSDGTQWNVLRALF
jgi:hypothetical protein